MKATAWYEEAFSEQYRSLYNHRDARELRSLYALLTGKGFLPQDGVILDVGCGFGRWTEILTSQGIEALGIDLSLPLLRSGSGFAKICGEFRYLPVASGSCASATSIFSSFGYFETAEEDWQHLSELVRVVRAGGWILLDTAPVRTLKELISESEITLSNGVQAHVTRHLKNNRVIKTVRIEDGNEWTEKLRIYDTTTLDTAMNKLGCQLQWRIGNYDGTPFDETSAVRMIGLYVRAN